jgi:hypothetical protein
MCNTQTRQQRVGCVGERIHIQAYPHALRNTHRCTDGSTYGLEKTGTQTNKHRQTDTHTHTHTNTHTNTNNSYIRIPKNSATNTHTTSFTLQSAHFEANAHVRCRIHIHTYTHIRRHRHRHNIIRTANALTLVVQRARTRQFSPWTGPTPATCPLCPN